MEDFDKSFWDELKGKSFWKKAEWCCARIIIEIILACVIAFSGKETRQNWKPMLKKFWWAKIIGWAMVALLLFISYKLSKL